MFKDLSCKACGHQMECMSSTSTHYAHWYCPRCYEAKFQARATTVVRVLAVACLVILVMWVAGR